MYTQLTLFCLYFSFSPLFPLVLPLSGWLHSWSRWLSPPGLSRHQWCIGHDRDSLSLVIISLHWPDNCFCRTRMFHLTEFRRQQTLYQDLFQIKPELFILKWPAGWSKILQAEKENECSGNREREVNGWGWLSIHGKALFSRWVDM